MTALASAWSRLFPGEPEQIRAARRFARTVLADDADADVVELVVSELATNALLHTASGLPDGWFVVHIVTFCGRVRIRVFDLGGGNEPTAVGPSGTEHGRGLLTVVNLVSDWGVEGDKDGRVVWADIPLQC